MSECAQRHNAPAMALVVFLRGVNVGGHRTFRPSVLAKAMKRWDVVNVGAAGTFVVRAPISEGKLRAELRRRLPFETEIVICRGRELVDLATNHPFGDEPDAPDVVRFVCVLSKTPSTARATPIVLPPTGKWLLRVIARDQRFVFGRYRRHMKVIGYLGKMDDLFGVKATTRNWNTIRAVVAVLEKGA